VQKREKELGQSVCEMRRERGIACDRKKENEKKERDKEKDRRRERIREEDDNNEGKIDGKTEEEENIKRERA